ncbi:MAG: hydroxymethylglutaryl-CoA lyase [Pyrinomonadaceae bacterium]|nr:hydroxymethylglutaryl-CoA lyase [Pyrinomonadaceae bacterium]MCX7640327.1 hydroxymethylglutaryl-CoA lyase [Pyrinomonadaceae bacterium]MDW8304754.1 hydroxymethylglutaryl-CoA lyase [Acidobacteriota bacterium]
MIELPKEVEIVEVSPRDGLQSLTEFVSTDRKLSLIEALKKAGFRRIEVTSFVSQKHVPQMADAEALMNALKNDSDFEKMGLALNDLGYKRAIQAGVDWICYVISATETMSRKNANTTLEESLEAIKRCIRDAHDLGIRVRASIAVCWVCPYEGKVPKEKVLEITSKVEEADEIAYNDTVGRAVPNEVYELCYLAKKFFPKKRFAGHFHDTNSTALANIYAAMSAGWTVFDSAIGGLGGCPFSPGAKGNVATEKVVWMLEEMGIKTGLDYEKLKQASALASEIVTC